MIGESTGDLVDHSRKCQSEDVCLPVVVPGLTRLCHIQPPASNMQLSICHHSVSQKQLNLFLKQILAKGAPVKQSSMGLQPSPMTATQIQLPSDSVGQSVSGYLHERSQRSTNLQQPWSQSGPRKYW